MHEGDNFGRRLRRFRRQARDHLNGGSISQDRLADLLSEASGIVYSRAAISDWERGKGHIHKDHRHLLTHLIGVLHVAGGVRTLDEANEWLKSGNYRALDRAEMGLISAEWQTPPQPAASEPRLFVPALPNHPIVGRAELLEQLQTQLFAGKNVALSAINGLPGVGKTTLATLLAHDPAIGTHFPDGVLWVGLGRDPDIFHLLGEWGRELGIAEGDLAKLGAIRLRANAIHDIIKSKRMLLIMDDVWEYAALSPFQLGGSNSLHLLTTRQPPIAAQFAGEQTVKVPELSEQFAIDLLRHLAPRAFDAEPALMREVVQMTGGLPLALVLIGNHLRVQAASGPGRRIRRAVEAMFSAETRVNLQKPQPLLSTQRHPSLSPTAPISLAIIIDATDSALTPSARAALRALALFPPKPNSFSEEAALFVANCTTDDLDELTDHGLLEVRRHERYELHQSICDYARHFAAGVEGKRRFVRHYCRFAQQLATDQTTFRAESDNVTVALDYAEQLNDPLEFWELVDAVFPFFDARGEYALLQACLTRLAAAELPSAIQARVALHLGQIGYKRSQNELAERHWERGIELARVSAEHALTFTLASKLSMVASERRAYDVAARYLDEAIELADQTDDHFQLCRVYGDRGRLAIYKSRYEVAEASFLKALAVAEQHGYTDQLCRIYNTLGIIAKRIGNKQVAYDYYLTGLQHARQLRSTTRILEQIVNLGELLNELARFEEAIAYLQEGITLAKQLGDIEKSAHMLLDLSIAQIGLGALEQANETFRNAKTTAKRTQNSLLQAFILSQWGQAMLTSDQFEQAEDSFSECLQLMSANQTNAQIAATAHFGMAKALYPHGAHAKAHTHAQQAQELLAGTGLALLAEVNQWLNESSLLNVG